MRPVSEVLEAGSAPIWRHPEWRERFPWVEQGTTGRGDADDPFDLGAFGSSPIGPTLERWRRLRVATGMRTALHARQIHAAEIGTWDSPLPPGMFLGDGLDGHISSATDLLLAVSVADCVPVFFVSENPRLVGVAHAGWRGVAAGLPEKMVAHLTSRGATAAHLWVHCGPAICGRCYEVGPEVHAAVNPGRSVPSDPTVIDLRQAIADRLEAIGVSADGLTGSAHCTRCGPGEFFSHRGGSPARQMGILGLLSQARGHA